MANAEHLALLKQGVDAWNTWKANNPDIRPNLSFATGDEITTKGVNLSGVDLSRANLSKADLGKADLIGANLHEANLSDAYLSQAELTGANLTGADLSGADLIGAKLIGANLTNVYLSGADLSKANLSGADLIGAKLIGAKLSGTNLSGANLNEATLIGAHLKGAILKGANIKRANFSRALLAGAHLQRTKALDANFSKATLTGACLENWQINGTTNLSDVICDYIYLKAKPKERCPAQGHFTPGEFTQLFQQALENIELIFRNGIDWPAFFSAFRKLQVESSSQDFLIQAFENRSDGSFVIRINIPPNTNRVDIENYLKQEYATQLKAIDRQYRYQLQADYEQIATYRHQSANLTEIIQRLANQAMTIDTKAAHPDEPEILDGEHDTVSSNQLLHSATNGRYQSTIQHNSTFDSKPNITDAATKIQQLLQQLEQIYPINTPLEKQIVITEILRRIESNPTLKAWVVRAIQGVNTEALKILINHPLINLLIVALEGYKTVDGEAISRLGDG